MQERRMRRIDADFERLQPIAIPKPFEGERMRFRRNETIERRACRGFDGRVKPRPNHTTLFNNGIRRLPNAFTQSRALRFAGCGDALPVRAELPSMKRATNAAALICALQPTKCQIGTAMRTRAIKQRVLPSQRITKQNKVLSQRTHRLRRPRTHARIKRRIEFSGQRNRLPITAQQRAARCCRANASKTFVLSGAHAAMIVPVALNSQLRFHASLVRWSINKARFQAVILP